MSEHRSVARRREIRELTIAAIFRWGRASPRRLSFALKVFGRAALNEGRRRRGERRIGGRIPQVVAISPTMRCNYHCIGCYSQGRDTTNELSTSELDSLLTEAKQLGVHGIGITGGEPFIREDLIPLMSRHKRLLFVVITNGSLITEHNARELARSGNVVMLVSIEGSADITDYRRQPGAHQVAVRAMEHLLKAGVFFGFCATNTRLNTDYLGTEGFIDSMIDLGCAVGYFVEYVPCGPNAQREFCVDEAMRDTFREQVLKLHRSKRITLIQFPQDEYGPDNRCSAAGQASLHINSQGGVEPCPFAPITTDNVRQGGLKTAFRSPFLKTIREHPSLLKRREFPCALYEHRAELEKLSRDLTKI